MKKHNRKNGYSVNTAVQYLDNKQPIYSLSSKLEPLQRFENNHPTGEVVAYKAYFIQEGMEQPFFVKFESKINLPNFLTPVIFEQLEACEVGFNVYFRATDLKEVK